MRLNVCLMYLCYILCSKTHLYNIRRCSGYVEQFDVQSAELTCRETIKVRLCFVLPSLDVLQCTKVYPLFCTKFSAKLRLDKNSPVYSTPDGLDKHVEQIIETLGESV